MLEIESERPPLIGPLVTRSSNQSWGYLVWYKLSVDIVGAGLTLLRQ